MQKKFKITLDVLKELELDMMMTIDGKWQKKQEKRWWHERQTEKLEISNVEWSNILICISNLIEFVIFIDLNTAEQ